MKPTVMVAALTPRRVGGIALSRFCYRRRKTLAPQGPRKLPKLDVAGSTPVARSLRRNPPIGRQVLGNRRAADSSLAIQDLLDGVGEHRTNPRSGGAAPGDVPVG